MVKQMTKAQAYINKIRNHSKTRYAEAYRSYLLNCSAGLKLGKRQEAFADLVPAPDRGDLSFMGAQAVRSMLLSFQEEGQL
jgi:hypothetical protein